MLIMSLVLQQVPKAQYLPSFPQCPPLLMVIISFTTAYPVVQGTSWPLPGKGTPKTHSPWRSWCLITPKLYVVPLLYSACIYSLIISIDYYHDLQWILENIGLKNSQAIIPLNDMDLQASWGDGVVDVSDTHGAVWIISEADNGYTYVTSTSWLHFPSSFPLVVSRMAVTLLSGVLQTGR